MFRVIVIQFLCVLPIAVIAFVAGMVFMRANYLQIIRWQKRQINRMQRREAPAPCCTEYENL